MKRILKGILQTVCMVVGCIILTSTANADALKATVIDQYGTNWIEGAASNIFATIDDQAVDSPDSGEKIIAPGTRGEYSFTIKNDEDEAIVYLLNGREKNTDAIPLRYRFQLNRQEWLVGDANTSVLGEELYPLEIKRTLPKHSEETITLYWEWPFERDLDRKDTLLGDQAVEADEMYHLSLSIRGEKDGPLENSSDTLNPHKGENTKLPQTGDTKNSLFVGVGMSIFLISIYIVRKRRQETQ